MDNRTRHELGLEEEGRRKLEAFANASVLDQMEMKAGARAGAASKKKRTRRGWSKWWRKQLAAYEASR